jgi:SSS family solute:Na+ symporter
MLFLPLFPGAKPPNPLVAEYVGHKAGAVLGGLVFVTVMAAILSTMSAAINSGAFSLTGDLLRYRKQTVRDRGSVAMGRAATLFVGGAAFLVATRFEDILTTLGLASQIMAEGLFIPGLAALLMRKRAPLAGLLSLFGGGGYALVSFLAETGLFSLPLPPWPRSLPLGLATSAAGFILGFLVGSRKGESSAN